MTNFKYEFDRVSGKECPMFSGQYALKIIESKKGQTFSQIMHELSEKLTNPDVTNIMNMQYILYVEIHGPIDEETFGDVKIGLQEFDKTSFELRDAAAKTEEDRYKESARRPYAYLYVKGAFDVEAFASSFDGVHVDLSKNTDDELNRQLVNLIAVGNRTNPTTFTISRDLANKLNEEEFGKSSLATYLRNKSIFSKNVFAQGTTANPLTNNNVRLLA